MKRKILYVASTFSHIRNFHLPYLQAFTDRGWEVHVACGGPIQQLSQAERVVEIPFSKQMSFLKNKDAFLGLKRLLREEEYDLISTHTSLASCFVRLAVAGMKHRPLVACMVHGYLFDEATPLKNRVPLAAAEKVTASVTDLLLTMNHWDEEYARRHRLGKQVCNLPGIGVPFEKLDRVSREDGLDLRRSYGLRGDQFVFVYAAEFSKRKSQETLLRAMTELPEQVALVLAGQGELWEECRTLARSLNLEHRVIFPGQVRMPAWYAAADGAVSSSRSEGLPFNIMESMYLGLPVVATAVKGHEDLIVPEESGLLYPFGDSEACARQMERLWKDPALCRRMGDKAHRDVARYGLEAVLPQVMQAYEGLLPLEEPVGVC